MTRGGQISPAKELFAQIVHFVFGQVIADEIFILRLIPEKEIPLLGFIIQGDGRLNRL